MKLKLKEWLGKLKTFIDAWKIWLFFLALFGTNGIQAGLQEYVRAEPEKPVVEEKPIVKAKPPQKTIIIHKVDNSYCEKLIETELNKHYDSSRH